MCGCDPLTTPARARPRSLARAAACLLLALAAPSAAAQATQWERLPLVQPEGPNVQQRVETLTFLRGEGPAADDPAADSLLIGRGGTGLFLYNPSGEGGAAGSNGESGAWHRLCWGTTCMASNVVVTASNSILLGSANRRLQRSVTRGRSREILADSLYAEPLHESALPALAGANGHGLVVVVSDDGRVEVSLADGASGTWERGGLGGGLVEAIGEVPPSTALPSGRLLMGVWDGVTGSTDGGASFQPTSLHQAGGFIAMSFAFVPDAGHPYGGVALVGVKNTALYPDRYAEVYRSDDGGQTWAQVHRFTAEETGLPALPSDWGPIHPIGHVSLAATPDGSVWASVGYSTGSAPPGVILRSTDLGVTWSRADLGFEGYAGAPGYPPSPPGQPYGWRAKRLVMSRTGVLYAATDFGVWRTTQPVVSSEAWPTPASSGLGLAARPNPSSGAVTLMLVSERAERVRVEVVDTSGRVVHEAVEVWATPSGTELRLPSERWAAGVYVARASVGRHTEHVSARFTVMR